MPSDVSGSATMYGIFLSLWRHRIFILISVAVSTVATLVVSLVLTPTYVAEATLYPLASQPSVSGISSTLSAYVGLPTARGDQTEKIQAILSSRTLREQVVDALKLTPVLAPEIEAPERARQTAAGRLQKILSIGVDGETGVIAVRVEHSNPLLCRDIANSACSILEKTLSEQSFTISRKNVEVLRARLAAQQARLTDAQDRLATYQKEKQLLQPDSQVSSAMRIYSDLMAKRIAATIQLSELESALSPDNPKVVALRRQVEATGEQMAKMEVLPSVPQGPTLSSVPDELTQYSNLTRELETAQSMYLDLRAQYERALIDEQADALFVEVIDPAIEPLRPVSPQPMKVTLLAAVLSFVLGAVVALIAELVRREKAAVAEAEQAKGAASV